jgi:hypothetical protein
VKSLTLCRLGVAVCCAVAPLAAQCPAPQAIPVYATGKQAITLPDPHWWLVQTPTGTGPFTAYVTDNTGFPFATWVADDGNSSWISPLPSYAGGGTDAEGLYTYATRVDLTGFRPETVSLTFRVAVDNYVKGAVLNGADTGLTFTGDGLGAMSAARTISAGFRTGANVLMFTAGNLGGTVGNPSGFRMEVVSATGCPVGALTVTPITGPVGIPVSLTGTGFAAGEDVIFYGAAAGGAVRQLGTATADLGGNLSGSARIPVTPLGAYNLKALGQTSGTAPTTTFAVTPRLAINPATGRIGDSIHVQAFGFAAGEMVDIGWNNPRIPLVTAAADATGSSGVLTLVIPAGPGLGPNLIVARGRTSLAIGSVAITLE